MRTLGLTAVSLVFFTTATLAVEDWHPYVPPAPNCASGVVLHITSGSCIQVAGLIGGSSGFDTASGFAYAASLYGQAAFVVDDRAAAALVLGGETGVEPIWSINGIVEQWTAGLTDAYFTLGRGTTVRGGLLGSYSTLATKSDEFKAPDEMPSTIAYFGYLPPSASVGGVGVQVISQLGSSRVFAALEDLNGNGLAVAGIEYVTDTANAAVSILNSGFLNGAGDFAINGHGKLLAGPFRIVTWGGATSAGDWSAATNAKLQLGPGYAEAAAEFSDSGRTIGIAAGLGDPDDNFVGLRLQQFDATFGDSGLIAALTAGYDLSEQFRLGAEAGLLAPEGPAPAISTYTYAKASAVWQPATNMQGEISGQVTSMGSGKVVARFAQRLGE